MLAVVCGSIDPSEKSDIEKIRGGL